jgi:hypothetical protein
LSFPVSSNCLEIMSNGNFPGSYFKHKYHSSIAIVFYSLNAWFRHYCIFFLFIVVLLWGEYFDGYNFANTFAALFRIGYWCLFDSGYSSISLGETATDRYWQSGDVD